MQPNKAEYQEIDSFRFTPPTSPRRLRTRCTCEAIFWRERMLYVYLLAGLSLAIPAAASPTSLVQLSSSSSACLAVLLTLLLLFTLLLIVKHVFMKERRVSASQSVHNTTRRLFKVSKSYYRSSNSVNQDHASLELNQEKRGLLIGLFGSPSWETRVKSLSYKADCRGYGQFSFMYNLNTESRRRRHSQTRRISSGVKSSLSSNGSGRTRSVSVSTIVDSRALYEIRAPTGHRRYHSFKLPARPCKAHLDSPTPQPARRFSLPSASRKETTQNRKHSSLKSHRSRRSDVSRSSLIGLGNSSLRLVDASFGPDQQLPLSPRPHNPPLTTSPEALSTNKFSSRSAIIPPMPSLPALGFLQAASKPITVDATKRNSTDISISHPYALSANRKRTSQSTSSSYYDQRSTRRTFYTPTESTPPPLTMKADCQSPTVPRVPFATVTPELNLSRLDIPFPSPTLSPGLPPMPFTPPNHTATSFTLPKLKPKPRSPSVRIRRSPAIGPSPLRSMILPDPSEGSLGSRASDKENSGSRSRPVSIKSAHSQLGLGLPSTRRLGLERIENPENSTRGLNLTVKGQPMDGSPRPLCPRDDDDPNILLGMIRELVEETSEWDSSLFMDEGFKSLIQESKMSVRAATDKGSHGIPEERSAEVDLGLLGLDIFRNDSKTSLLERPKGHREKQAERQKGDLVSFWDDGGWVEHIDRR